MNKGNEEVFNLQLVRFKPLSWDIVRWTLKCAKHIYNLDKKLTRYVRYSQPQAC